MREADDSGEGRGEDGEVQVLADEVGVVREERGVKLVLDAGDVEAAVFGEGMIAVDAEGAEREGSEQGCPGCSGPGFRVRRRGRQERLRKNGAKVTRLAYPRQRQLRTIQSK